MRQMIPLLPPGCSWSHPRDFGEFVGLLEDKFIEILGLKAPGNYSASIWYNSFFDFLMGEPQTPHFYEFWIFGHVPGSQNQFFLSVETSGHLKYPEKVPNHFWKYYFYKSENVDNSFFRQFPKRRTPKIPTIRTMKS